MSPEIHFALKRLAATLASEWLEARMFPTMGYQIGRLAKRFTTVGAFVGLLSYNRKKKQATKIRNV